MNKYLNFIWIFLLTSLSGVSFGTAAHAAQEIVLISDQSQIINLPETPSTVLVGNPAIADVTTEGRSIFIHPRGYGLTNILVLDEKGRKLGDFLVRIIYDDSYSVAMYGPGARQTYSCRRDCEPTMRIGDGIEFFSTYATQVGNKSNLAASQAFGDDSPRGTSSSTTIVTSAPR